MTALQLDVAGDGSVSAILDRPASPWACYVLAHGAGAGMRHPFLAAVAARLVRQGMAVLRYQFPYMERGRRRPDPPHLAHAAVRAAVEAATTLGVPLIAGGKSFGGRMTSQAQAAAPLNAVLGLAFLGFPLHQPGKPGTARADHLDDVRVPMLFLQGTRDPLAALELVERVRTRLGDRVTLHVLADGDHSFKVPKRAGRSPDSVMEELAAAIVDWGRALL